MKLLRCFLRVCLWLNLITIAISEQARMRLSGGHIVTSSTLKWVPGTVTIPNHSIPVTEDDLSMVWCRAKQHGIYVGGALSSGVCKAPFLEQVIAVSEGYEILVSVNGSSRLKRVQWDQYNAPPKKSIASSEQQKQYLAFNFDDSGNVYAGYLLPTERRVYLVDGDKVRKEGEAFVLVEDEPETYDLRAIVLEASRVLTSSEEIVMKKFTLSNKGSEIQSINEIVDIISKHIVYWGQVKGTLIGRMAFVIGPKPDREEREIIWGIQNEFDQLHSQELAYELDPGTATEVKVIGTFRKVETPYVGTLTATYEDEARLSRVIEGLHIDKRLTMLTAIYSSPFFTTNNTRLDIDERIDVLYKSTTTTTTTTTTTSPPITEKHLESSIIPETPAEDKPEFLRNVTIATKKGRTRNLCIKCSANEIILSLSFLLVYIVCGV